VNLLDDGLADTLVSAGAMIRVHTHQRLAMTGTRRRISRWSVSLSLLVRELESRGHVDKLGERTGLHLSHHLTSVCLYRDLADVELATDLFIQQAGGY
jgi:hypothetical protein